MKTTAALVTLAIGSQYLDAWKRFAEPNWRSYAERHRYDIVCIDTPLDTSERAQKRSPAWQKCLVLSQNFSSKYDRIVWVDADILINAYAAPDILEGVPAEKVGAAEEFSYSHEAGAIPQQLLGRVYKYFDSAVINYTSNDYYTNWGLPGGFESVVQTGVLVLSPQHHREMLEKVYYQYEEKGGAKWNYEMRPLSYELMKASIVQWLDPRFNNMWPYWLFMYYPFLIKGHTSASFFRKVGRKLAALLDTRSMKDVRRYCLRAAFCSSYFFHLGGGAFGPEAALVDTQAPHSELCLCEEQHWAADIPGSAGTRMDE